MDAIPWSTPSSALVWKREPDELFKNLLISAILLILNLSKSSDDICSIGDESNSVSFKLEPVIKTSSISWE